MSRYTDNKSPAVLVGADLYQLAYPLAWHIGTLSGPLYEVQEGFLFDVSIPWWATWLFSRHDPKFLKAAALHDHMLQAGWSRITAGAEFHNALAADRVPVWQRITMWLAVSLWKYGET